MAEYTGVYTPLAISDSIEGVFDAIGMGAAIDMFGVWGTIGIAFVTFIIVLGGFFGGRKWLARAKQEASAAAGLREEIESNNTNEEIIQTVNEKDDDILSEATRRLERRGEDITGEALSEVLNEIEQEEKEVTESSQEEATGLLNTGGDRQDVARMSVAPERVEEHSDYMTTNSDNNQEYFIRNLIISAYPDRVTYGWLDKMFSSGLSTNGADVRVSYHMWPRDPDTMMGQLDKQATRLTSTIRRKKSEGKIDVMEEEQQREKINQLREKLSQGSTKLFDFSLYIQVIAEDENKLNDATEEVKQFFAQTNARVQPLYDRQLDAYKSIAPLGKDIVRKTQIMDLQSLGTTFPFIEPTRMQASGVLLGFHQTTNSPVVVDRFELSGHNALVSGKIGSGKSYLSKLMMWRRLMMDPETELLVIDPVGGFGDMVEAVGGQVIRVDKDKIINPLEIRQAQHAGQGGGDVDEDPYNMKIRSVMGMFQSHFSGERSLSKGEEGVLRRAIRYAYLEKGITKNPKTHTNESPTIQNIIDILDHMSKGENPHNFLDIDEDLSGYVSAVRENEETSKSSRARADNTEREASYAHNVLLGMEEFTAGGQRSNLNGQTNINLNNRVVQFDLENVVDANNAGLFMHIMLDYLFQRAKASKSRTMVTIDEAHYMLGEKGALDILNTFARHSRHYTAGMTLISQTVDEFMEGKAKEIYDQCDIRILMRHEDIGQEAMDSLGLTPPERDFVLSAQAGNTADHSEALIHTTDSGKRRIRVYSNQLEHHVVDEGAPNVWSLLYQQGTVNWETIPPDKKDIVRRELSGENIVTPA